MKLWTTILLLLAALTACAAPAAPIALTPLAPATLPPATATPAPLPTARSVATSAPADTPTPAPSPTPAVTRLLLWHNLPPAQADALAADVAAFGQRFSGVAIELQAYDDPATLSDAILAGRADYDLLLGPAALLAPLQQANKIQAMDELFPPSFLDGFAGVTLTGARRQRRVWGLPDTAGFHLLLFYNRERVESPPAATDELAEMAAPLTGGASWGLALNSYDPLWVLPWLAGYGGWLTDDAGNPTLNSAAMVRALSLYRDWHRLPGGIAPLVSHVQAEALFRSGQAAMLIDGEWALEWLPAEADFDWGAAPLPVVGETGRPAAPLVVGRYWAVGSETSGRRAEGAIAFLEFITRPERQLAWTAQFGLLPTRRDALSAPPILTDPLLRASAGQLQAGRGVPLGVDVDALLNAMRLPLRQLLNGDLSPEEAARQMQANVP